jgi:uncharacterized protein
LKYLIWAVVIYFAWRWYLVSKQKSVAPEPGDTSSAGAASNPSTSSAAASAAAIGDGAAEKMIACAHCSIHLPLSEALTGADQRHYCSAEHRALHVTS